MWYVSKAGLVYKEKARQILEKERLAVQAQDKARLAQRQLQVGRARQAVLSRSQGLEELF